MNDKVLSMISLAKKSGSLVSGEFTVEKTVKSNKAYLVIVAEDSSERTKKSFKDMCSFYNTAISFYSDKEKLGQAIGFDYRASIAITNENFAKAILDKMNEQCYCTEVDNESK